MTLAAHVQELRTLAVLAPEMTVLEVAMINVLEELAEALDGLRGRVVDQGDTDQGDDHLGTI